MACWSNAEDAEATDLFGGRGGWKVAACSMILMWEGGRLHSRPPLQKHARFLQRNSPSRFAMAEGLLLRVCKSKWSAVNWDGTEREQLVVAGDWRKEKDWRVPEVHGATRGRLASTTARCPLQVALAGRTWTCSERGEEKGTE